MPKLVKHTTRNPLSEEEMTDLELATAVPTEMTEAELLMMAAEGGQIAISDPGGKFAFEDEEGLEEDTVLFRLGTEKGKDVFQGRLTHKARRDFVTVWRRNTGMPVDLPKDKLVYYISKGSFVTNPAKAAPPDMPSVLCPRSKETGCTKMLRSVVDAEAHFRVFHNKLYKLYEREKGIRREQMNEAILTRLLETTGGNAAPASADLGAVVALLAEINENFKVAAGVAPDVPNFDPAAEGEAYPAEAAAGDGGQ
jgi:hypothetical protein